MKAQMHLSLEGIQHQIVDEMLFGAIFIKIEGAVGNLGEPWQLQVV